VIKKKRVIILGGQGRIGGNVAEDLQSHTEAEITVTGRGNKYNDLSTNLHFLSLDLEDREGLKTAINNHDLVIHCAGPFHYRDGRVLQLCI